MIRRSVAVAALAIGLVMTTKAAEATPIFSNYGPGDQYGLAATGLGIGVADPFVAGIDASLTSISLSLSHTGASDAQASIYLMTDAAGVPGAIIESFLDVAITAVFDSMPDPPVSVLSSLHPLLHSGTTYWIAAKAKNNGALWGLNSTSDMVDAYSFSGALAGPWTVYSDDVANVFRVEGTAVAAVPEPASMLLLGTGITGLIARRIRGSKAIRRSSSRSYSTQRHRSV